MFERFTDRARRVVVIAQDEARRLGHDYVGTEHMLSALIAEDEGVAAIALKSLHLTADMVRDQAEAIIDRGEATGMGHIPFNPRLKNVIQLSLRESIRYGHNYIGTEHLLLGLTDEGDGVGVKVLKSLGVQPESVRAAVMETLSAMGTRMAPVPEPGDPVVPVTEIGEGTRILHDGVTYVVTNVRPVGDPVGIQLELEVYEH